jgi:DNA-binding transcriptional LysR family regulator
MDLNLRQLRLFITVAEELNFSQAAKRLYLDQATLSRNVRQLEEHIGVKLLDRTTRSVTVTKAGQAFLAGAREVIDAADAAVNGARDVARGRVGTLKVGMMVQCAEPIRSAAFNLFEERNPEVLLRPVSFPFVNPSCGLENRETDVALVWLPIEHPEIKTERLFEEPRYFIVADSHRLADRQEIHREEVDNERFFTWPESWGLSPMAMAWGDFFQLEPKLDGTRRDSGAEAHDEDEWLDHLVRGRAISTAPASARKYYSRPGLKFIRAVGTDPAVVAVAWRRDDVNPLVLNFIDVVRELRDANSL